MLKFAILTTSHERAVDWLRETYGDAVTLINRAQATGKIRLHNVDRDFVIVHSDHEERLHGIELMGFEVIGPVRSACIQVAKTRVRS
jgi:hypothetical protein